MDRVNQARFEEVVLPHVDSVHRMARALARDAAQADDLVQETFVRALRGYAGFELRAHGAKPWLLRILHNTFLTMRDRQRRSPLAIDAADLEQLAGAGDDNAGIGGIDWEHVDEELKEAVHELPDDFRVCLLLWSIDGLSYKEIAEVCECPIGTVMSRLFRARQLLGARLKDYAKERKLPSARLDR